MKQTGDKYRQGIVLTPDFCHCITEVKWIYKFQNYKILVANEDRSIVFEQMNMR